MAENEAAMSAMFRGGQIPESVRARILAGQLLAQSAGAASGPYTSKGVVGLKALEGLMGGVMESSAIQNETQAQAAHRVAIANLLGGTATGALGAGGAAPAPASGAPMPSAMPMGRSAVGSDAVASGSARNPNGYDPRATEALIRSRAPAFGIDPDTAVRVARSEGLNVYHGDGGSSFGPFQLHYGGVADGGNRVGGLGDVFTRQTGLDARDPSTVPQQVDFALSQAAKGGWGPWHGAQRVGLGNFAGIGQGSGDPGINATPRTAAGQLASVPGSSAMPSRGLPPGGGDPEMPARNAQPVASNTLPPDVTPDMVSASPKKPSLDAIVTGAMAKAGMDTAGLPAAGQGQPSSASAAPASSLPAPFDPEGTGAANYDPSAAPLMGSASAALAQALQSYKPSLGQVQPAVVPDPVSASAPPAPPAPSILPPARPPSGDVAGPAVVPDPIPSGQSDGSLGPSTLPPPGLVSRDTASGPLKVSPKPSLNDIVTGAMAKAGYDTTGLPVSQPPVVPPPQGDLTAPPPSDPVGAGLAQGRDVALDPTVPDPQGSLVPPAPSSPNGALAGPQSDAAMGNGVGPMGAPGSPPPPLPDAGPMPPPGTQTLQAPADAVSAAAAAAAPQGAGATLDAVEGTGPANYPTSSPAARAALAAALGGPAQGSGASTGPGQGAAQPAMGAPPSAPLPLFAQRGVPGPTPMPAPRATAIASALGGGSLPSTGPVPPPGGQSMGSGSSLPQTGPMPPLGVQSLAAANPDAPAPNAVQAGPAPLPSAPSMSPAFANGANAVPGHAPSVDPSSPQSFMRQELARQLGGGTPSSGGSPLDALGSLFGGGRSGAPQGANPAPAAAPMGGGLGGMLGGLFGGGGQQPGPAPAMGGGGAQTSSYAGGAPMAAQGGSQAGGYGGMSQQQAFEALMKDPRTTPAEAQLIISRLYPTPEKVAAGDGLVVRQADGSYRNVYSQPTKDLWTVTPDGTGKLNKATGAVEPLYGNGAAGGNPGGWRPMTPAERQQYGVTDGRPAYVAPNNEPHFGMPETQGQGETAEAKSAGEAAAARRNDMLMAANSAPEKIARLKLLGTVLDNTATGPLAPEIGNAGAIATRLGIAPERLSALGIDPNQAVNNAIANKLAGEMTMSSIGAKNGGMPASNFSVAERQFIEGLYPNIENQAGGNRAVTDVLTAVEQKKMQWADAWSDYKDRQAQAGKPLSYENFEDQFRRAHSQDNIFAPIMQRYQAGGYTPTMPSANGVPVAPQPGQGQPNAIPQGAQPSPMQGGQGAPPQQQGGQGQGNDALSQARAAIARGAPRGAVIQRLQGMGINTTGL